MNPGEREGQHLQMDGAPSNTCPKLSVCRPDLSNIRPYQLKEHNRAVTNGNLAKAAIVAEHAAQESHVIDWKEACKVWWTPNHTPSKMST